MQGPIVMSYVLSHAIVLEPSAEVTTSITTSILFVFKKLIKYSGTLLIHSPMGQKHLAVLIYEMQATLKGLFK